MVHRPGAAEVAEDGVLGGHGRGAADRAAEAHPGAQRSGVPAVAESAVGDRLAGADQRELGDTVEAFGVGEGEAVRGGVEVDLGGDLGAVAGGVEEGDAAGGGAAGGQQ